MNEMTQITDFQALDSLDLSTVGTSMEFDTLQIESTIFRSDESICTLAPGIKGSLECQVCRDSGRKVSSSTIGLGICLFAFVLWKFARNRKP